MAEEKRKFMRFSLLLDAIFRGGATGSAKISDFSRNGLGIISEEDLKAGERLELELNIPGDNIPIICEGEIAWSKKLDEEPGANKYGVKIEKMDSRDRGRILEYIYTRWIASNVKKGFGTEVKDHA